MFSWDETRCDGKKGERRENIHQIQIFQLHGPLSPIYPGFHPTGTFQHLLKLYKDED